MAIKVKLGATENTQEIKPFPKLMKSTKTSLIVLMIKKGTGLTLTETTFYYCGDFIESFDMNVFIDYNEPITIQNL